MGSGMRRPRTFAVLKWVGPAVLAAVYGIPQAVAQVGATFTGVKDWAEKLFSAWWPTVTSAPALVIMAVLGVGYLAALLYCGTGKPKVGNEPSPISVADVLYVESGSVADESSADWPDLEAVTLYLQITNARTDALTLKNIRATLWTGLSKYDLPVKNGITDLRHGELEFIEIGTVVAKAKHGTCFGLFVPKPPFQIHPDIARFISGGPTDRRSLKIPSANAGLGDSVAFIVTITADDTAARTVRFVNHFKEDDAYEWIRAEERSERHE